MPRVTTNDGILNRTVTAPLISPTRAPKPMAATTASTGLRLCSRKMAAM